MREISFEAHWTTENCQLQYNVSEIVASPLHTFCQKITLCFFRILQYTTECIGYPIHQYAKQFLVGGTRVSKEDYTAATAAFRERWEGTSPNAEQARLRTAYEPSILKVKTPDGVEIEGTLYRSLRSQNSDIPTIICTNPNWADISREEGWNWLLNKGAKSPLPFNVIVFDYRQCAGQEGFIHHPSDLTLDGDTFYQFAKEAMHISEANIHYLGFCTGAQVAATLAALHPRSGRLASHNSTYNIGELMHKSPFNQKEMEKQGIPSPLMPVMKELVRAYLRWSGWDMDVTCALNSISNRTLFLNHAGDSFVSPELHASTSIEPDRPKHAALLRTKPTVEIRDSDYVPHWLPLPLCEDQTGLNATKKIVNFLLGQNVLQRHRSLEDRTRYIINGHTNGARDIETIRATRG